MLKENLESVESKIQAACDRAGRKREEVTLIAVSKTKPVSMLKEAYDRSIFYAFQCCRFPIWFSCFLREIHPHEHLSFSHTQ